MMKHSNYQNQLDDKIQRVTRQFAEFSPPELAVFPSEEQHFRQRAEFRIWHERGGSDEAYYAMFDAGQKAGAKTLQRIERLPIADLAINTLMPRLLAAVKAEPVLLERLYQVEFLSTLSGQMLVTLIYHKPLDDTWEALANQLATTLDIHVIGRSKGQKIVLSQDFVTETLTVLGRRYTYQQIEGGFTQPNARVCEQMLTWACQTAEQFATDQADLLELYCGNANFTLPLSSYFRAVLATEVAKTSVQAARHNIAENHCDNIAVARLSAEEFTQAYHRERAFRRLAQDNIELDNYRFSSIFVDPPRAGVDEKTLTLMQQFAHILYISCNPDTLADNLQQLSQTHHIRKMALFDQFPYTHHVEMGVWLSRR